MVGPVVALRCDAGQQVGAGHMIRCISLAVGLQAQGLRPVLVGDTGGVGLCERLAAQHQLPLHAPDSDADLLSLLHRLRAAAVVIDSYDVPPSVYESLHAAGLPVVAVTDALPVDVEADLVVYQTLVDGEPPATPGRLLAGPDYALLRPSITRRRPPAPPPTPAHVRRALVMLGATDVSGASPALCSALFAAGEAIVVDVIAPTPTLCREVGRIRPRIGQLLNVLDPVDDLAPLALEADLVVVAAGTTVWEMACLGRAMALVMVADNQLPNYSQLTARGVAAGLGTAGAVLEDSEGCRAALAELLLDRSRREALTQRAYELVDGDGAARVSTAIRQLLGD